MEKIFLLVCYYKKYIVENEVIIKFFKSVSENYKNVIKIENIFKNILADAPKTKLVQSKKN